MANPATPGSTTAVPTGQSGATSSQGSGAGGTHPATPGAAQGPGPQQGAPPNPIQHKAQVASTQQTNPAEAPKFNAPVPVVRGLTPEQVAQAQAAAIAAIQGPAIQKSGPMKVTEAVGSPRQPFGIYGENFGNPGPLTIAGFPVKPTVWRDSQIKGMIPEGVPYGDQELVINGESFTIKVV